MSIKHYAVSYQYIDGGEELEIVCEDHLKELKENYYDSLMHYCEVDETIKEPTICDICERKKEGQQSPTNPEIDILGGD